jgi:fatty-acyl-CoA synthase/long-chain acyl-CoA synthetase
MYRGKDYQNLIDYWAEEDARQEVLVFGGERYTYGDVQKQICKYIEVFIALDLRRGDVVLTVLGNTPDFLAIFFALQKMGCLLAPCDTAISKAGLIDCARAVDARLIIVSDSAMASSLIDIGLFARIVTLGARDPNCADLDDLLARSSGVNIDPQGFASPDDTFLILFTSGSTGIPKGAEHTPKNLFSCALNLAKRMGARRMDKVLVPLPLSHMFGLITGMLVPLLAGGCIVLMKKWDSNQALDLIESERVSIQHGVPTMFFEELKALRSRVVKPDIANMRCGIAAGAFVSPALVEQMQAEMDFSVLIAYGTTETVNVTMSFPQDPIDIRKQTIGKTFDGIEIRVVDDNNQPLSCGSVGELVVRGDGVMKGYWGLPEKTAEIIDADGWLHEGDLVCIEDDGYLRFLGRKKDIILRGGNNIAPMAIECLYTGHFDVLSATVLGYHDEALGERIAVFIEMKQDSRMTPQSMRVFAQENLPKYSIPDRIIIKNDLPKLYNGKIDRVALMKELEKRVGADLWV